MCWARVARDYLVPGAESHGGEEMTIGVIVRQGLPTETLEPSFLRREPRTHVKDSGRPWWSVVRRLQSVVGNRDALIEMRIDLDHQGNPSAWREPIVRLMARQR
jgi:hypothetical protein